ncbi:hypothetical protein [Streptomyces clavuligerus]|uniref:hypothetical protein n=1 Tax=Streptomyces clavuligerus TaxID=1901 RepID=UPI0034D539A0
MLLWCREDDGDPVDLLADARTHLTHRRAPVPSEPSHSAESIGRMRRAVPQAVVTDVRGTPPGQPHPRPPRRTPVNHARRSGRAHTVPQRGPPRP